MTKTDTITLQEVNVTFDSRIGLVWSLLAGLNYEEDRVLELVKDITLEMENDAFVNAVYKWAKKERKHNDEEIR